MGRLYDAFIEVGPKFTGFGDIKREGDRAGQAYGKALADAAAKAAAANVRKLGEALASARNKEADAAGKVRVAEQKLNEVRADSKSKASQVAAAEEALATAQRKSTKASEVAKGAASDLGKARDQVARAAEGIGAAGGNKFNSGFKNSLSKFKPAEQGKQVMTRFGVGLNGAIGSVVSKSAGLFAAGFAAVKVGGIAKDAVNLEATFSQTMNTMAAVAKVPQAQIKQLSDLAIKMGADTTFSASEAAGAMLELAKGGLSAATIQGGALAGTLTLASAGGTDLATASTIASNALNTFGLKGKDMASVAAALAGGANASSASVESLGEALGQVGPGATNAGLTLQGTVGVLSAFDAAGIKGADAGTSLKTMLTRLVPATTASANAMKDLGLKFTDANGKFLPITNIAQQLKDKMSGLSDEQKTLALNTIFGSDATRAATVLMKEGATGIGGYIKATQDQNAAQAVATSRMKGTAGALESFKGSVETAKLQLGLFLAPAVQASLGAMTKALNGIAPAAKKLAPVFKVAADGIGEGVKSAAADAKQWSADIIKGFTAGFKSGDWKPLGKALGDGAVTAIKNLGDKGGDILDAVGGLIDKIDWGKLGSKISTGITGLFAGVDWKALGSSLGDSVINLVDKASNLGDKLGSAFKTLIGKIDWKKIGNDSTTAIIGFIEGVNWGQVAKSLSVALFKSLKINISVHDAVIAGARDLVIGMFNGIIDQMSIGREWLVKKTEELGGYLIGGLKSGVVSGLKGMEAWLEANLVEPIHNWVKSLFGIKSPSTMFAAIGTQLIAGLKVGVVSAVEGIGNWISRTVIAPVVGAFSRSGSWLVQHGRNLVAGFKNGVSSIASRIGRWIYGSVISPTVAAFGKAGSWLVQAGKNTVAGFKNGAGGIASGIGKWIYGKVISPLVAQFGRAGSWLHQAGKNVIAGFKNGMVEIWADVTSWVGGIATWIKDHKGPVSLDGTLLIPAGHAIMSGFLKGLKSGAGPAWDFVKSVGGKTVSELQSAVGGPFSGAGKAPTNPSGAAAVVRTLAAQRGWGTGPEWDALYQLVQHESGFNSNAKNPTSTAYGLFQFLDSTWGSVGASKTADPFGQTAAGLTYIARSYGDPINAWSKWQSRSPHWYKQGTPWVPDDQLAYLHKGEGVIPADENAKFRQTGVLGNWNSRVRSQLHRMHEAHLAHVAHVAHVNDLNHLNHIGRTARHGVGADTTPNGVTGDGLIKLHPQSVAAIADAMARVQLSIDGRSFDSALTRSVLGR